MLAVSVGTASSVLAGPQVDSTTVITRTIGATPSVYGTGLGFTATASGPGSTATGTIRWQVDGSDVGSPVTLDPSGQAIFDATRLGVGDHTIGASYSGDSQYSPSAASSLDQSITQRDLHVTATGINKTYDGDAVATVTLNDDRVSGDTFTTETYSASFDAGKNVGTGLAVSVTSIAISGGDSANYNLANTTTTTSADISQAALDINAVTDSRGYNGTAASTVSPSVSGTVYSPDSVTGLVQVFDSRNAGARTLSVSAYTVTTATVASTTASPPTPSRARSAKRPSHSMRRPTSRPPTAHELRRQRQRSRRLRSRQATRPGRSPKRTTQPWQAPIRH